jgi:hypothetical protein
MFNRAYGATNRLFTLQRPTLFDYQFGMEIDHDKVDAGDIRHYLLSPAIVDMFVDTKLKFHFDEGTQYAYKDTLDADLNGALDVENLKIDLDRVIIDLTFINSIPIKVSGVAKFLDENGNVVLERNDIKIESPEISADGTSVTPKTHVVSIALDHSQGDVDNIMKTKRVAIEYTVEGRDAASQINIRSIDKLRATISLFIKGKIEANLDSIF